MLLFKRAKKCVSWRSSKVHWVRAELWHMVCNTNTCIPLIAEESKGTEFQKQWHSKLRNCRCEASLVKPASKMKAGLWQENCSKEGGLVAPQSTNSCILLPGTCTEAPQILYLLSPILGTAPAWGGAQRTVQHPLLLQSPWHAGIPWKACPEPIAAFTPCCCRAPQHPWHPGIPAQAFPEGGHLQTSPTDPGKQAREAEAALLCCSAPSRTKRV